VGDQPAFVNGVAVEAAGELVVDTAAGHFFKRGFGHRKEMFFFGLLVTLKNQINCRGVREFRGVAEAAVFDVEKLGDGFDLGVDGGEVEIGAGTGEDFGLRNGIGERISCAFEIGAFVAVGIGNGEKNAAEPGAAHLIFWRKISAAKKGFAVGEKKTR
jgi:hypothetical protein